MILTLQNLQIGTGPMMILTVQGLPIMTLQKEALPEESLLAGAF